jgi:Flp pilus assembly pilin Flp
VAASLKVVPSRAVVSIPNRSNKVQAGEKSMFLQTARRLWCEEQGQDIAEYAVMLAVILVIVVGTIRLIGSNANNVFSNVASSIQ